MVISTHANLPHKHHFTNLRTNLNQHEGSIQPIQTHSFFTLGMRSNLIIQIARRPINFNIRAQRFLKTKPYLTPGWILGHRKSIV